MSEVTLFDERPVRRVYDKETETWWFSVVDIVQILTQQPDRPPLASTGTSSNNGSERKAANW